MKLIFENENEENTFWAAAVYDKGVCPSHFGLHEDDSCLGPEPKRCFECWKNSGLETGVKSESDSTAEFKARLERLRKFIFMICGDDWSELIQEAYGQCALTPEDVCFLCEIEEEEEENHETPLISREKILEKRCDRYREIIHNHVNVEDMVDKFLKEGKLSPNDARYLFELEEVDTAKGLIGFPEVFADDPYRTVKKNPPLGCMTKNNKGPMERYYNDVREYLKAKFPDALDSDIQETAAFATNRANVTACDIVRERDWFWCDYINNSIKISDERYGKLLDIMRRRE